MGPVPKLVVEVVNAQLQKPEGRRDFRSFSVEGVNRSLDRRGHSLAVERETAGAALDTAGIHDGR
jgi:hypothetical protein